MAHTGNSYSEGASVSPNHKRAVFKSIKLPLLPVDSPPLPSSAHSSKLPSPQIPSFCFKKSRTPSSKPLIDIEDVRAFIHSKFGSPRNGNGSHSAAKKVPVGVFGLGTMGSSGSDGGYVDLSSPQANEHQGEVSSHSPTDTHTHPQHAQTGYARDDHVHENGNLSGCPERSESGHGCSDENMPVYQHPEGPYPILHIEDVQDTVDCILHFTGFRRHPTTSWLNKMPWRIPRAPRLAKGLECPPKVFDSEEARQAYYRKVRKRKRFLLGAPPLWTVTALNLAFIQLLMYNPLQKFFDYLRSLP